MANKKKTLAQQADKYAMYLDSVQDPGHEVDFLNKAFKQAYGRRAEVLREDFCGTYAVCCEWVKSKKRHHAIGVDIDPEPLAWGKRNNESALKQTQVKRLTLLQDDVRNVAGPKADVIAAQNFSFWFFKTRDGLRTYFRAAHANLKDQGVLVADMMGGPQTFEEGRKERRRKKGFTYVWEQARFDPITHDILCHIHFEFKDGSRLKRAFTYAWRLWSIPEVRELMDEAGFTQTHVYWEGTDPDTGEGDNRYRRRKHAPCDPAWISYVVGVK
jgi:hypothetical protein